MISKAQIGELQTELTELLSEVVSEQDNPLWPGLRIFRVTEPTTPNPVVYRPCLCVVAQGAKLAILGERVFRYDPLSFLIIGAPLPLRGRILEASPDKPFISMVLEIDSLIVHELLLRLQSNSPPAPIWDGQPPIRSSPVDEALIDALMRFLRSLRKSAERDILAPSIFREIVYHLLDGDQGDILRLVAARHGQARGIVQALDLIHNRFEQSLDVPTLARAAGMSVSGLHHNFKAATTLSPMQYIKRIRLEKALQLMADQSCSAGEAGFRVGYASSSQFSREFKRLFGSPPRKYVESQRIQQQNMEMVGSSLVLEESRTLETATP